MRRTLLPLLLALAAAGPAAAGALQGCTTSIRGETRHFVYDPDSRALRDSRSMREWLLGRHGEITCPGLVTLRALTPEIDDTARAPFCLQWDAKAHSYTGFAEGARDAWMTCRKPSKSFCQRVNASAAAAGRIAGNARAFTDRIVGGSVLASPVGVLVVQAHAAQINAALSQMGVAASTANPAALSALAVSAVVVQGAVYVCAAEGAGAVAAQAAPDTTLAEGAEARAEADAALLGADLPATSPAGAAPRLMEPNGPPAAAPPDPAAAVPAVPQAPAGSGD